MVTEKKVEEIMSKSLISIPIDLGLKEAAAILADNNITGAIVVDNFSNPVGVISGIDIAKIYGQKEDGLTAKDIMTTSVYTITPETTIKEAAKLICKQGVHRLFVSKKDSGRTEIKEPPLGIVTTGDIIKELARHGSCRL